MFMLDTDICSYILREKPQSVLQQFIKIDPQNICISVITEAELRYGVARSESKKINRKVVEDFLDRLLIMEWDSDAAIAYGELRAALEAKGKPIGNMDLMIASHALTLHATVVTNNTKHFQVVPKLKTQNWL